MTSWLESLVPWGTEFIRMVQSWHTPWLTSFLKAITVIGDKEGYLLLFPFIYWCVNERWGRRIGILTLASLSLNDILKAMVNIPRPAAPAVKVLVVEHSPSFPSGHAQGTLSIWGYLAVLWKSWPVRIGLLVLVLLVAFSRIYLGAHYPQDILGGWCFALFMLGLFIWLEPRVSTLLLQAPLWLQVGLAVGVPILVWSINPHSKTLTTISSAWVGVNLGIIVDVRWLHFSTIGQFRQRALRYLGVIVVGILFVGLKKILPANQVGRAIRYSLVGCSITCLMPWIFLKLGWASTVQLQENDTGVESSDN